MYLKVNLQCACIYHVREIEKFAWQVSWLTDFRSLPATEHYSLCRWAVCAKSDSHAREKERESKSVVVGDASSELNSTRLSLHSRKQSRSPPRHFALQCSFIFPSLLLVWLDSVPVHLRGLFGRCGRGKSLTLQQEYTYTLYVKLILLPATFENCTLGANSDCIRLHLFPYVMPARLRAKDRPRE